MMPPADLKSSRETIRLPIPFFILAFVSLALTAVALPLFAKDVLAQHHYTQRTVALTHLISLGWITTLVLGAATQLVPVALGTRLHSPKLSRWVFGFHAIGVTGMVASFWCWNFRWLLWFGSSFTIGLCLFLYNMIRTMRKAPRQDLVTIHIGTAWTYLILTFLAGQFLMHDKVISFSPFHVLSAIHAHAHLAVLGWFFMMILGVSYRLIPMFLLSEIQSPRRVWSAFALLNTGIPLLFLGILLQWDRTFLIVPMIATGLAFWMIEVREILKASKRPAPDSLTRHIGFAMAHLPALVLLGFWLALPDTTPSALKAQAQTGYGILVLFGFVTCFIMAFTYKILPFLVWYQIYPPFVGLRPVPKLEYLYSHTLQRWAFRIFLPGVWATAITSSLAEHVPPSVIQASAGFMGLGLLLYVSDMAGVLFHLKRAHQAMAHPENKSPNEESILPKLHARHS